MRKLKSTDYKNFSFPLFQSLILNYLLLNSWLIKNSNNDLSNYTQLIFNDTPLWITITFINIFFSILFFAKKISLNNKIRYFLLAILFFQLFNIKDISSNYFWETVPDSSTYRVLGEVLLSCGRLALSCETDPFLQWPIGQPILSGLLSIYFYNFAKYIYLLFFLASVYLIGKVTEKKFGNIYIFGLIYFSLMSNNYEISSLILSEVPYSLLSCGMIFYLDRNKLSISFWLGFLSFIIRPIGIINIFIFFLYLIIKKRGLFVKFLIIFIICCITIMSYNLLMNDNFIISTTVSTNIEGDGIIDSSSTLEYATKIFSIQNFEQISKNIQELYGQGSRDCRFEKCFLYNPLFNSDGTVPQLLNKNSVIGRALKPLVESAFKITSPLGIWIYLPFLYILSLRKKDLTNNFILTMFCLNILLSVLTKEYGSRWWLLPNLLSIYLFSSVLFKFKSFIKNIFKS
tara:strand:+ start:124 stop:1497 length:1374 start_codon:yes stop_codon:yes gene_type:complete